MLAMQRSIINFGLDDVGDWFAVLDCGHLQHVRHQPPFVERVWVTTAEGRAEHVGHELNCVRCDNFELPQDFVAYKRTPEFTAASIPAGLLKDHSTKKGVWARIVVLEGGLHYCVDALNARFDLDAEHHGVVVPEVLHFIAPRGEVRFYVEFYRAPESV
jgi:tellurite methyltransferase